MIKISLNTEQRKELEVYRSSGRSENAERALMVLMNADGVSPPEIAKQLRRHPHTVRDWLRRYKQQGISGLNRLYAPGKLPRLRQMVGHAIEEALLYPPSHFKYPVSLWTTSLLADWLRREKSIEASQDTIERALKERGYRFCRSGTQAPLDTPSKEEKLAKIGNLIDEMQLAIDGQKCAVLALDESHFSTEPYVLSGWQKKLWPPENSNPKKARASHRIWRIEFGDRQVLLEERKKR